MTPITAIFIGMLVVILVGIGSLFAWICLTEEQELERMRQMKKDIIEHQARLRKAAKQT